MKPTWPNLEMQPMCGRQCVAVHLKASARIRNQEDLEEGEEELEEVEEEEPKKLRSPAALGSASVRSWHAFPSPTPHSCDVLMPGASSPALFHLPCCVGGDAWSPTRHACADPWSPPRQLFQSPLLVRVVMPGARLTSPLLVQLRGVLMPGAPLASSVTSPLLVQLRVLMPGTHLASSVSSPLLLQLRVLMPGALLANSVSSPLLVQLRVLMPGARLASSVSSPLLV